MGSLDSCSGAHSATSGCLLIGSHFREKVECVFYFQVSFSHSIFCAIGFLNPMNDPEFNPFRFQLTYFFRLSGSLPALFLPGIAVAGPPRLWSYVRLIYGTSSSSGGSSFCAKCQLVPLQAWQGGHTAWRQTMDTVLPLRLPCCLALAFHVSPSPSTCFLSCLVYWEPHKSTSDSTTRML